MIGQGEEGYVVASESHSFINLDYTTCYSVAPGEIVKVTLDGVQQLLAPNPKKQVCSFLWIYYGYPASDYEGVNVEEARYNEGREMGKQDYIDIDYVAENYISLHREEYVLFGLKIIPPKIALESDEVKRNYLSHMSLVLNSCDLLLYHDTIRSPIDVSVDIMNINNAIAAQKDEAIRRLWINEAELLKESSMNMASEFFILHKCRRNDKKSIEKFDELFRRFKSERFEIEELRRRDLLNYIAFKFCNEYIYDFYFPRGAFEELDIHREVLERNPDHETV